jgi:hypothetical protein
MIIDVAILGNSNVIKNVDVNILYNRNLEHVECKNKSDI